MKVRGHISDLLPHCHYSAQLWKCWCIYIDSKLFLSVNYWVTGCFPWLSMVSWAQQWPHASWYSKEWSSSWWPFHSTCFGEEAVLPLILENFKFLEKHMAQFKNNGSICFQKKRSGWGIWQIGLTGLENWSFLRNCWTDSAQQGRLCRWAVPRCWVSPMSLCCCTEL